MEKNKKSTFLPSDDLSFLVTEQRGLFWSSLGFFVALFVGLAFQAGFSSERVTRAIRIAAEKIHPSVRVDFENAYLSLSDGLFPELSVVVENVVLQSEEKCWGRPVLRVDDLRLPLQLLELLRGRVTLANVIVGNVDLELRESILKCEDKPSSLGFDRALQGTVLSNKTLPPKVSSMAPTMAMNEDEPVKATRRNPVEKVTIRSLRVISPDERWTGLEARQIVIQNEAVKRKASLVASVNLPVDSSFGDYGSSAELLVHYNEAVSPQIEILVSGTWREGAYRIKVTSEQDFKSGSFELETKHLPLGPVLGLASKQHLVSQSLFAKSAWISTTIRTVGPIHWKDQGPLVIDRFKLEGDLGEIDLDSVQIQHLHPLEFTPFVVGLRGVRVEELLKILGETELSPTLGDLGTLNGQLKVVNPGHLEISGEHTGLQFVFSNRGAREVQTLSLIAGSATFKDDHWSLLVDRVRPLEGLFLGKIKIKADRSFKEVRASVDIDEMSLNPQVQKVMTGGGALGAWSGVAELSLKNGKITQVTGNLNIQEPLIENVQAHRVQVMVQSDSEAIRADLIAKKMEVHRPSRVLGAMSSFWTPSVEDVLQADLLKARVEFLESGGLKWVVSPVAISGWKLNSVGAWDDQSQLSGQVKVGQGNHEQLFIIEGTRDRPLFKEQQ